MNADVGDLEHASLEQRVDMWCREQGFITFSLAYHDVLPEDTQRALAHCGSITSHVVRTRSDRHAVNPTTNCIFKWDAKTCTWPEDAEFAIEYVPLVCACMEAHVLSTPYVFCCERKNGDGSYGVTAGLVTMQNIQRILIPTRRWNANAREVWTTWIKSTLAHFDINPPILETPKASTGSGDPFVALDVSQYLPWETVLQNATHPTE